MSTPSFRMLALAAISLLALGAGCSKESSAATTKSTETNPAATPLASKVADSAHYKVEGSAGSCAVGAECTVTIKLAVKGDYHINESYPYKWKFAKCEPGKPCSTNVTGSDGGTWAPEGKKNGTLTFKATPSAKGAKILGIFKMAVCSESTCETEEPELAIDVDVK